MKDPNKGQKWKEEFADELKNGAFMSYSEAWDDEILDNEKVIAYFASLLTKERAQAEEREAYLWFNTWYSKTIDPKLGARVEPFGTWATKRLQTLGATLSPEAKKETK